MADDRHRQRRAAGSASVSNGIYTVNGCGNISGTADNFRFLYQSLSGDGEITAQINSVQNTGTSGRIGVMIRESLTSGSSYAFMGFRQMAHSAGSAAATLPAAPITKPRPSSTPAKRLDTPGAHWQHALRLQLHRRHNLDEGEFHQHHNGHKHLRRPRGRFRQFQHAEHVCVLQRVCSSLSSCIWRL